MNNNYPPYQEWADDSYEEKEDEDASVSTPAIAYPSERASTIVTQERDSHGDAYDNHKQIADLWSAFLQFKLDEPLRAWEAAIMMQMVKQSRMQAGRLDEDHFVDIAGYANVAYYSARKDPDEEVKK